MFTDSHYLGKIEDPELKNHRYFFIYLISTLHDHDLFEDTTCFLILIFHVYNLFLYLEKRQFGYSCQINELQLRCFILWIQTF